MKRILLTGLCIFLYCIAHAQYISFGDADRFYMSVPTPISLHPAKDVDIKRMSLQVKPTFPDTTKTAITNKGDGNFEIMVRHFGRYEMTVLQDGNPLYTVELKAIHRPECQVMFSNRRWGKVKDSTIMQSLGLIPYFPGVELLLYDYPIISFTILRVRDTSKAEVKNIGPSFNNNAKKLLSETLPGDIYFFHEILIGNTNDKDDVFYADNIMIEAN